MTERRGGGGGGGDIAFEETDTADGDEIWESESWESERWRCGGGGGGDFKLGVLLRLRDASSSGEKFCGIEITFDLLFGGGAGADLMEEVVLSAMLPSYAGSISSLREVTEVCVLLRDRIEGAVLRRLDLLARGIVGGIRRVVVTSGTSEAMSIDLVGEIMSLSMDAESRLEGRGCGGRGLFKSVLVGDVGEGLDTVIGTF